jgi:hypothetical protein
VAKSPNSALLSPLDFLSSCQLFYQRALYGKGTLLCRNQQQHELKWSTKKNVFDVTQTLLPFGIFFHLISLTLVNLVPAIGRTFQIVPGNSEFRKLQYFMKFSSYFLFFFVSYIFDSHLKITNTKKCKATFPACTVS